ncbi:MAG TPA: nucleotidyltransferase domain-containing protein [Myxococcota bacterium]
MKSNNDIALCLDEIADLLDLDGANPFRVRAYRNAARKVRDLPHSVHDVDLRKLGGIGADLAGKIAELSQTGTTDILEEEREKWPAGVRDVLKVQGLGPKRVKLLHEELGVNSVDDLRRVVNEGLLLSIPGLGASLAKKLTDTLKHHVVVAGDGRFPLEVVAPLAEEFVAAVRALAGVKRAEVAGSYRRKKATVGDLDIVSSAPNGAAVIAAFAKLPKVVEILGAGDTRASVKVTVQPKLPLLQIDLRVVDEESYGAALLYLTGSKGHSIELRAAAIKRGLKLNEYGVWKDDVMLAGSGASEESMYAAVGMTFLSPEQRER